MGGSVSEPSVKASGSIPCSPPGEMISWSHQWIWSGASAKSPQTVNTRSRSLNLSFGRAITERSLMHSSPLTSARMFFRIFWLLVPSQSDIYVIEGSLEVVVMFAPLVSYVTCRNGFNTWKSSWKLMFFLDSMWHCNALKFPTMNSIYFCLRKKIADIGKG